MEQQHDKHFMQMAVDLSEQAVDGKKGGPFGAIVVMGNTIVGSDGNHVFKRTDPCAHAEIMAIRDAATLAPLTLLNAPSIPR